MMWALREAIVEVLSEAIEADFADEQLHEVESVERGMESDGCPYGADSFIDESEEDTYHH
jgi:hypothetical protein